MPSISTEIPNGSAPIPIGRPGVAAALGAEHLDEQVGRAVGDEMLLLELRIRVDQHEQLHDPA